MPLEPGVHLGVYEIVAPIGAGGMGEVYRARDTKLDRAIALKILPETFASDPERIARFEREAKTLAALNHPHIAQIHGFEHQNGTHALVMELVEGEDLAERIAHRPVPLDEALSIARQIANALEAAHEQGIIHRDLKPANIKVRRDGTVKVLDFGLAKALDLPHRAHAANVMHSPTITTPAMTLQGVILGTAAYMSPEQAKGRPADRRSDIWAFGCVLYEMLSGRRAFEGDEISDTMAAVLRAQPDWSALPAALPPPLLTLLRRCLEKDPGRRLHDMADARLELDDAASWQPPGASRAGALSRRERVAWLAAVAALVVAAIALAVALWRPRPITALEEVRFDIATPPALDMEDLTSIALSPDGRTVTFVAPQNGRPHLWLRRLDAVEAYPLAQTDEAAFPFWSPDGRTIGFAAEGWLKRVDLDGGAVRVIAPAIAATGASWSRDDVVVFAPTPATPIYRVAPGDAPRQVTKFDDGHAGHVLPWFLPDGRHFLFYVFGGPDVRGVHIGQLESQTSRRLFESESASLFAAGHLLFIYQGALYAQPFDPESLALGGPPRLVARGAAGTSQHIRLHPLSAAANTIVFRAGGYDAFVKQMMWVDRAGRATEKVGERDSAWPLSPVLSPDGRQIALLRRVNGNADVWLQDTRRGVLTRLTDNDAEDIFPIWNRDGSLVVFTSFRNGETALYQKHPTLAASEEVLLRAGQDVVFAADFAPDGSLLFMRRTLTTAGDLWALPPGTGATPYAVLQTSADERDPRLSPDGKWIAYMSNNTGVFEVYVDTFPVSRRPVRVSPAGGAVPLWSADGRELYYLALDGPLMAVPMTVGGDGRLDPGLPQRLFTPPLGRVIRGNPGSQYAVSPDGRFLLNASVVETASASIRVILNWKAPAN